MQIRITPRTKGNRVNVRHAMSGKGNAVVVKTLADGDVVDAELSRNENWFKVDGGYVRAELAVIIPTKIAVESNDDVIDESVED